MEKDTIVIIKEIEQFKAINGGDYDVYYIGITKHIEQRLIENNEAIQEHLQKGEYSKENPTYTAECKNNDEAVGIERYFQKKGMLQFNPRSFGVKESKFIYCYKMTEENKKMVLSGNSSAGKNMATTIKDFKNFKNEK